MKFTLCKHIGVKSDLEFSFIAVNETTDRVICIEKAVVGIFRFEDPNAAVRANYAATDKYIDVDFEPFDKVVRLCIGSIDYDVIGRITPTSRCTFVYKAKSGKTAAYEIDNTVDDSTTCLVANVIVAEMTRIRDDAFEGAGGATTSIPV